MLWRRVTYEMMESYWPAVARGEEEAQPAMREWAVKLEATAYPLEQAPRRGLRIPDRQLSFGREMVDA